MPKVIVCLSIDVDVALLVQRLGPDRAAAVGQDVERQHVGGALVGLGAQHADRALDGLGGEALAGADDRDELVEEPLDEGDLGGLAAQRDLVAAHVDVGVERLLDEAEVLVTRARGGPPWGRCWAPRSCGRGSRAGLRGPVSGAVMGGAGADLPVCVDGTGLVLPSLRERSPSARQPVSPRARRTAAAG